MPEEHMQQTWLRKGNSHLKLFILFVFAGLLLLAGCGEEDGGTLPYFPPTGGEEGNDEGAETGTPDPEGEENGEEGDPPSPVEMTLLAPLQTDCVGGVFTVVVEAEQASGIASLKVKLTDLEEVILEDTGGGVYEGELDATEWEDVVTGEVVATAEDGEKAKVNVEWTVDNTPPELTLTRPDSGDVILGNLSVRGSATDEDGCGIAKIESVLLHFNDDSFDPLPVGLDEYALPEPVEEEGEEGEGEEGNVVPEEVDTTTWFKQERDTDDDGTFMGQVVVVATDRAGNTTEESRVVFVVTPLDMLEAVHTTTEAVPQRIAQGDYDQDGLQDVFIASNSGVLLLQSKGKGGFEDGVWLTEEQTRAVGIADVNEDGLNDMIALQTYGQDKSVAVYVAQEEGIPVLGQNIDTGGFDVKDFRLLDMNGDGFRDVVVMTQSATESIGVLLATPEAEAFFEDEVAWASGVPSILDLAGGDFNSDGLMDVVVCSKDNKKISVFAGDGAGGFYAAYDTLLPSDASAVEPGLFDADEALDLVVVLGKGSGVDGKVIFLEGQGNGYFQVSQDVFLGGGPTDVSAGDFDQDALLDVAISFGSAQAVAVVYGRDSLLGGTLYAGGPTPAQLLTGHFTEGQHHDGLDLVVMNTGTGSSTGMVTVVSGDGDEFFHAAPALSNPVECRTVNPEDCKPEELTDMTVGQYDGLPGLDLAAITDIYPLEGDGDYPVFNIYLHLSDTQMPSTSADFILEEKGSWFIGQPWAKKGDLIGIRTGDFDGDGTSDLAVGNAATYKKDPSSEVFTMTPVNVDIFLNKVSGFDSTGGTWIGRDPAQYSYESKSQTQGEMTDFIAADLLGEGRHSLVTATPWVAADIGSNWSADINAWISVGVDASFQPAPPSLVDPPATSDTGTEKVIAGDVDQDGAMDLIGLNKNVDNVSVHYGDGVGNFADGKMFSAVSPQVEVAALETLNADEDGYPDLISVGKTQIFIAYGREHEQGDNPFEPPVTLPYEGASASAVVAVDLNQDGLTDVVVSDDKDSTIFLYANLGNRKFADNPVKIYSTNSPLKLESHDLDEDGCPDLVAMCQAGVTILRNLLCE